MHKLLAVSLSLFVLAGCSRPDPPKTLPSHFEGTVGGPMSGDMEWLSLDLKQDGANLTGTYEYTRSGTIRLVKGEVSGTTGGNTLNLKLKSSAEAQQGLGWSETMPLNAQLGEVPREAMLRQFSGPDKVLPKELKEGTGPIPTLTGAIQLSTGGQTIPPRPVVLYAVRLLP